MKGYRYWIDGGKSMNGYFYSFNSYKVYSAYKQYGAEEIRRKDYNESFTGKFLSEGFTPSTKINPINNWFGVSLYNPDLIMKKGSKEIVLSLQGVSMPMPNDEKDIKLAELCECKYIHLKDGNKYVYRTWAGILPSEKIINNFINA